MKKQRPRQRPNQISLELSPVVRLRLDEIVYLAKRSNPKMTRSEVFARMISDLHRTLTVAKLLPLPMPPEIVDLTASLGRNGNGDRPNGE